MAYAVGMEELAELTEADRDRAMARFRLLQPHLEEEVPLRVVAAEAEIPFRTAQRWVFQYRLSGLAALVRKTRGDRGARRVVSGTIEAASYWTVYDVVRQLPRNLRTLAHEGAKSYGENFDLVHRREAVKANSIWQADHVQLDIKLLREDGSAARPWLTIVIDDYSRVIAGYYLGFEPPSSIRTSLALRQGIWRKGHPHWQVCGIPDILYTDNGTDFTSRHLQQVAADLKMRLVFSIPGKPRGRGRIERFFRTVNDMFLCDLDGFVRYKRRSPSLTLDRFEEKFRHFLLEVYHRRSTVDGRLPPAERWEEGGFLPRMPDFLEQLDLLLMHEVRPRKIRRDGIHFQGLRYLSLTLAAYVGEEATIRFDPRDMGEICVFYQDRFLCRAISAETREDYRSSASAHPPASHGCSRGHSAA